MNEGVKLILNFIITAVVAWLTAKIAFKSDIKKYLHSKREKLYFELYSDLDAILMDTSKIYDREITKRILDSKPALKLVASKDVIMSYIKIYDTIGKFQRNLESFESENDPNNKVEVDDDGMSHYSGNFDGDMEYYAIKCGQYKRDNLPDSKKFQCIINEITNNMRNDLGSRKIRWGENGRV